MKLAQWFSTLGIKLDTVGKPEGAHRTHKAKSSTYTMPHFSQIKIFGGGTNIVPRTINISSIIEKKAAVLMRVKTILSAMIQNG